MQIDPEDLELQALRGRQAFAGRRVLEIGAGDGRLSEPLAPGAAQWVALDPDRAELVLAAADPIRRAAGDARRLPFRAASFDVVFLSYALC